MVYVDVDVIVLCVVEWYVGQVWKYVFEVWVCCCCDIGWDVVEICVVVVEQQLVVGVQVEVVGYELVVDYVIVVWQQCMCDVGCEWCCCDLICVDWQQLVCEIVVELVDVCIVGEYQYVCVYFVMCCVGDVVVGCFVVVEYVVLFEDVVVCVFDCLCEVECEFQWVQVVGFWIVKCGQIVCVVDLFRYFVVFDYV